MEKQVHTMPPIFDGQSRILILGSFPSVKSRQVQFYYGNPQNRFWNVLAGVLGETVPEAAEGRRCFLLSHGIALWDVIKSCVTAVSGMQSPMICLAFWRDAQSGGSTQTGRRQQTSTASYCSLRRDGRPSHYPLPALPTPPTPWSA